MTQKRFGAQLYASLPKVYRARDNGDLERYLEPAGELFDLLRDALEQQLANAFPDQSPDHKDAQRWALPYLAELVGVRPVSPEESGQRREIAEAIRLRQRKGTLGAVVDIAAMVGEFGWRDDKGAPQPRKPLAVQEGWKRVAITPRIGDLLLPESAYGAHAPPMKVDSKGNLVPFPVDRHAGLPAVTVDFRYASRRVRSDEDKGSPTSQANPHGIPSFRGSSEDVSRRTPDVRSPTWSVGHAHPRRILVYYVPFAGFFPPGWDDAIPIPPGKFTPNAAEGTTYVYRGAVFRGAVSLPGDLPVNVSNVYRLEDCIVHGTLTVESGRIELVRCAVDTLDVKIADAVKPPAPALSAEDCLFEKVTSGGTARLVGVTVAGEVTAAHFQVSDSLLAGAVTITRELQDHCFRYSRVRAGLTLDAGKQYRCFSDDPLFFSKVFAPLKSTKPFPLGAYVLHPASGPRLLGGAEDGGEVGAYHHRHYAARVRAVEDKLRDHLPLGQMAVLIPDPKLACEPPTVTPLSKT